MVNIESSYFPKGGHMATETEPNVVVFPYIDLCCYVSIFGPLGL